MKISRWSLNESEIYVELIIRIFSLLLLILTVNIQIIAQDYNRGIGIYPGNPKENFSPIMKTDKKNYRNIALLKPVYSSGSYDYNLTAQLITYGIIESKIPEWIVTTNSDGTLHATNVITL